MSTIRFQIRTDYDSLQQFLTATTEKAVWKAAMRAGNDSIGKLGTEANRRVRGEIQLKAKSVREGLKVVRASTRGRGGKSAAARWRLGASGAPIPLYQFSPSERKSGAVSVNVKGKRKVVEGGFVATMPSGHTGIFERIPGTRMKGKPKEKIRELFSTRVSDVFRNTGFISRSQEFFQERFSAEWRRLIPVEIDKAKQRALRRSRSR